MGFDVDFTPPGDLDRSWDVFPARSECCPEDGYIKRSLLVLGDSYPVEYDPGNAPEVARLAAMTSLFDATDPADLGEGTWTSHWLTFGLPPRARIDGGGSGPIGPEYDVALHFEGPATSPDYYISRAKSAVKFGWKQGTRPPWRAIDGPTVTVSYYIRTYPLDSAGAPTLGSTLGAKQTVVINVAPGATEAFSDWSDFAEPSGNYALTIEAVTAYATQLCIGE